MLGADLQFCHDWGGGHCDKVGGYGTQGTGCGMYLVEFPCSMGLIHNHGEISAIIECGGNTGRICCSSPGFISNISNAVQEYC